MNEKLFKLVNDINKQMGDNMVQCANEMPEMFRIKSHIPAIDWCTGGGFPVNRCIELFGPESSGKTYNAMIAMREFQNTCWETMIQNALIKVLTYKEKNLSVKFKDGSVGTQTFYIPDKLEYTTPKRPRLKNVVLIDMEGSYDVEWATELGIDSKRITRVVPDTGEHAIDIAEAFLKDEDTCLVVFDSVGATRAAAEIEKSMEDQTMGLQARFWNRASAKFQAALNVNTERHATMILINRAYSKVGLVFGDPEQIGGGTGIRYFKAVSLKFHPMKEIEGEIDGEKVTIGRNIRVQNKKNKTAKPHREAMYFFSLADDPSINIKYAETDVPNDITELGVQIGLIEKKGNRYCFGRTEVNGRDNWVQTLRTKPTLLNSILNKFYENMKPKTKS